MTHPAAVQQQVIGGDPPPTTADLVDLIPLEQQQVVQGAVACLAVCDTTCHAQTGTLTCVRVAHPHTAQNCVVHAAYEGPTLIQWVHIR